MKKIAGQRDEKSNWEGTHFVYYRILLIPFENYVIWVHVVWFRIFACMVNGRLCFFCHCQLCMKYYCVPHALFPRGDSELAGGSLPELLRGPAGGVFTPLVLLCSVAQVLFDSSSLSSLWSGSVLTELDKF